jgi:hydroxypyruvate isomerase
VDNLKGAADRVAAHGITVLIEPLNKRDNPGYFLNTTAEAAAILKEVGRNNVKLQLDLYHCQITEGDLTVRIRNFAGSFAHVQIAGVPDRHEPDDGEVNFTYVLRVLDEIGYDGGWLRI